MNNVNKNDNNINSNNDNHHRYILHSHQREQTYLEMKCGLSRSLHQAAC